ncbi:MAG: nascent polypeptide-associated complex protein [Candidatus Jordarchaeum sp.]|uniref:nascent polypeptide-associated complex protein n=1 Tax=Candidatus Jordarchaeum sp. TaxID=2823881 RepID=UPI00404A7811
MRRVNPRQMKKAMQQMGIKPVEINATEVIIKGINKDIIISNPQVTRMEIAKQTVFQIMGSVEERKKEEKGEKEIPLADIQLVAQQAGVSEEAAKQALIEADGNLAKAILLVKE